MDARWELTSGRTWQKNGGGRSAHGCPTNDRGLSASCSHSGAMSALAFKHQHVVHLLRSQIVCAKVTTVSPPRRGLATITLYDRPRWVRDNNGDFAHASLLHRTSLCRARLCRLSGVPQLRRPHGRPPSFRIRGRRIDPPPLGLRSLRSALRHITRAFGPLAIGGIIHPRRGLRKDVPHKPCPRRKQP